MDTIEEQYELESDNNKSLERNKNNQLITNNFVSTSLFKKKNYILLIDKENIYNNIDFSEKNIIPEFQLNRSKSHSDFNLYTMIDKVLSDNDQNYKYILKNINENIGEIRSFYDQLDKNYNISLIIIENYNLDKHEKIIKFIKNLDKNLKIVVHVNDDILTLSNYYLEKMSIDFVLKYPIFQKDYENIFKKCKII